MANKKVRSIHCTNVSHLLAGHLGSTRGLVNSARVLTASNTYDSFSNPTNANFPTRFQYTGWEFDNFTGLQYSRARFYDPKLGRFISEDPIGFGGGDVNLYGYVRTSRVSARLNVL
ncbi:MAG: RHS repeat-associated core domain-containing protein [Acidobacteria bacterium]|nr:RHS repeat-associated core domain-containing protein [Acidobacteriota bacterium]